ncbi:M14 family zinc carboxypeptidase [Micromonospora peucetia]|uniref:M14 family zinc carboxypeptidase n=1 Tax=Micromonospora peucetia TaxID=47871 RepID=UPI00225403F6|nr:M14 family zinc carboxypeptidase [Micromonospora peucetia]MCX4391270.1 M14 family zinc carboxypeptidase [Micromonospora peucetia]
MRRSGHRARAVSPRRLAGAAAFVLLAATTPLLTGPAAGAAPRVPACSADPTARLASVPSPEGFLGFPLGAGQERVVTNDEVRGYLGTVDAASDRVVTGSMGTSVLGQPLPYAVVSADDNVRRGTLRRIADDIRSLRDPRRTSQQKANGITEETPAIVWITANVHGGEKSGADAALKTLYELAAGLFCEVERRNDNLVTIIDPILSPSSTGTNVLRYPTGDTFWANGYTVGGDVLKGTVALVDEPTGAGRAVLFAFNPLFRAYNENGLHLVANALLHPGNGGARRASGVDPARAAAATAPVAENLGGEWRPFTIKVAATDLPRAEAVVNRFTSTARVSVADGSAHLVIPNPDGLQVDEHPFLGDLVRALRAERIPLRSVVG